MELTAPVINLNGNDKDTLLREIWGSVTSCKETIDKIATLQYSNGRNAIDNDHRLTMDREKGVMITQIFEIRDSLIGLYNEIKSI